MPREGLILIDNTSAKQAEDLLSPLCANAWAACWCARHRKNSPQRHLHRLAYNKSPRQDFSVLDQALRDTCDDGGSITAKHQDLTSDEIQLHISAGKQVKPAVGWQDKLSFVIDDGLAISSLRFTDLLQTKLNKTKGDDACPAGRQPF